MLIYYQRATLILTKFGICDGLLVYNQILDDQNYHFISTLDTESQPALLLF